MAFQKTLPPFLFFFAVLASSSREKRELASLVFAAASTFEFTLLHTAVFDGEFLPLNLIISIIVYLKVPGGDSIVFWVVVFFTSCASSQIPLCPQGLTNILNIQPVALKINA